MSNKEILKYLNSIKYYHYTDCLDPIDTDLGKLQRKELKALKIAINSLKENQQLKEQLKNLEFKYQARSDRLNNKIKQRDEVIDEAIEYITEKNKIDDYLDGVPCHELLDILTKYKGDNNGNK